MRVTPRVATVDRLEITAYGPVRRPYRDFLAALGLSRRGNSHGITVAGGGSWTERGNVVIDMSQGTARCRDSTQLTDSQLSFIAERGRLTAVYAPFAQASDPSGRDVQARCWATPRPPPQRRRSVRSVIARSQSDSRIRQSITGRIESVSARVCRQRSHGFASSRRSPSLVRTVVRVDVSLAAICVAAASLGLTACGSSSSTSTSSGSSSLARTGTAGAGTSPAPGTVVGGVSARSVERALLANGGPPRPTSATCRGETVAERRGAPFGSTRRPVFSCLLTVTGERATYDVQVLANGCYVGERRGGGRAVYGCGAGRT